MKRILSVAFITFFPTFVKSDVQIKPLPAKQEKPIVVFYHVAPQLIEAYPHPTLQIWADGKVSVYFPEPHVRGGWWYMKLPQNEFEALLAEIDTVITTLSEKDLKEEYEIFEAEFRKNARAVGQPELFYVADDVLTQLEVNYLKDKEKIEEKIFFRGVETATKRFPEAKKIATFAQLVERLNNLTTDNRLKRREKK